MLDDDTLIREWLATREPTRCPTAAVAATTATLSPADMAALQSHPEPVRAKGRKLPAHMHRSAAENQAAKPPGKKKPGPKPGFKSPHRLDLTGKRFNHIFVLNYSHSFQGKTWWRYICDCGTVKVSRGDDLRTARSCGCVAVGRGRPREDLTGRRFGSVTVLGQGSSKERGKRRSRYLLWRCQCDCGELFETLTSSLKRYFNGKCDCSRRIGRAKAMANRQT